MNIPFPAVIKDIHIGTDGILATLDISPPDLAIIAELIDQEVTVTVSAATIFPVTPAPAAPVSAEEKLPFEPDDDFGEFADADLPPQPPPTPKRPRRAAKRTK